MEWAELSEAVTAGIENEINHLAIEYSNIAYVTQVQDGSLHCHNEIE